MILALKAGQEAGRLQHEVGHPIASDSVAFKVPDHWIQIGPGSLSPLSLPSPTNAAYQKDNPHLQQVLA